MGGPRTQRGSEGRGTRSDEGRGTRSDEAGPKWAERDEGARGTRATGGNYIPSQNLGGGMGGGEIDGEMDTVCGRGSGDLYGWRV